MIEALIAGERDPEVLAGLALGRLRVKIPELMRALDGRFDDHHAVHLRGLLDHIDWFEAAICRLDDRIGAETEPYAAKSRHSCASSVGYAAAARERRRGRPQGRVRDGADLDGTPLVHGLAAAWRLGLQQADDAVADDRDGLARTGFSGDGSEPAGADHCRAELG